MTTRTETLAPSPGGTAGLPSRRSRWALNAANFFLADMMAVVAPFLGAFLASRGWRYDSIGVAMSASALGPFLLQTPAGMVVDRTRRRLGLLAGASLLVGLGFAALPIIPGPPPALADPLLFAAGAATAFFGPALAAIALGLVGHNALSRTVGVNQSWNHIGNIAAALAAVALVRGGLDTVFYAVGAVSVLAAASALLVRRRDLDDRLASGGSPAESPTPALGLRTLLADRRVAMLVAATAVFHLANAPVMPLVALEVKRLQGTDGQVAMVVLVAQAVMVPVALAAGALGGRIGRKPVLLVGFLALPIRILLYSFAHSPGALIALQSLDGVGAGICGVTTVVVCADLTRGRGAFNALSAVVANGVALGGVVGPLAAGLLVQHLGFGAAYRLFAAVAATAPAILLFGVPETGQRGRRRSAQPGTRSAAGALPA